MTPVDRFLLARDIQAVLLVIFVVAGAFLLWRGEHQWRPLGAAAGWFVVVALLWVFVKAGDQPGMIIHRDWRLIDPDTATRWMLTSDLIIVVILVFLTGGSERSCFSPLYFMLPTFTLLLLKAETFFVVYSIVALVLFGVTLFGRNAEAFFRPHKANEDVPSLVRISRILLWAISALCLFLAVHIDVERHKSSAKTLETESPAEETSTALATPTPAPTSRPVASPTPSATTPVRSATPMAVKPAPTPSASLTPTAANPIPPPSASLSPAASATPTPKSLPVMTYSEFLMQFKGLHRKKESVQRRILRAHIGEEVSWDVKFQGYRSGRKESTIFISDTNSPAAKHRPVRIGKAPEEYRKVIRNLSLGRTIHIEGTLRVHSATELFVHISVLTLAN